MPPREWEIHTSKNYEKQLKKLPQKDARAVIQAMESLAMSEYPLKLPQVKKLVNPGQPGAYRYRQGHYRILFDIEAERIVIDDLEYQGRITFQEVLHRRDAYRRRK